VSRRPPAVPRIHHEEGRGLGFRSLRNLAALAAGRFTAGVILYTGREALRFAPNLYAIPMSALWQPSEG
jgi:hypothetical protein